MQKKRRDMQDNRHADAVHRITRHSVTEYYKAQTITRDMHKQID